MSHDLHPDFASSASPSGGNSHWTAKLAIKTHRLKVLAKKRWWVLFLLTCMGLAYQAYDVHQTPTRYESLGKMLVSGRADTQVGASFSEDLVNFYGTQIQHMESPEVWERARRRIELENPSLSGNATVTAQQVPRAATFDIIGSGDHPEYTQAFVNAVMEEVVAFKRDMRQESTGSQMLSIGEELARLRQDLDQREAELNNFVETNNMPNWSQDSDTAAKFLAEQKIRRSELSKELHILSNLTDDQLLVQQSGTSLPPANEPNPENPGMPGERIDSGSLPAGGDLRTQYLLTRQELGQKEAEVAQLSKVLRPKHPKLIAMTEQVAALQNLLGTIREQSIESSGSRKVSLEAEIAGLDASIEEWEQKNLLASRKGHEYQQLEGNVNRTRDLYEKLLLSIQDLDISKNINQESIQVMQHATPPYEIKPNVPRQLATGLILGLGLGLGLLLVLDRADDRITSFTEINEHFSLPVLGQIPSLATNGQLENEVDLLKPNDDRYMFAEAFRNLRSSLIFMPDQNELKTLLVTSSIPGEGKSTIVANMAVTLANAGTRVLLVDADLKRGDMAKKFHVDGRFGFSSVLRDDASWQSIAMPTAYENLTLIPRGPIAPNPAELLLQPTLEAFIADAREAYDLVLFNSAPILATDDTTTLAPSMDGVLMVIRAGMTSTRLAENSLNALAQRQVKVLGIILNSINTEMADYYHYRYSQYYSKV